MEIYTHYNVSDITYKSELTPTPIAYLAYAILQLVWGLNSQTLRYNLRRYRLA